MGLLPEDAQYLASRHIEHQVSEESGMTCILLPRWRLPAGLDRGQVDLLVRLAPGYPDIAPDMWWVDPPLRMANGATIPATESTEVHLGRRWQRWSRHFSPGQWKPGIDRLESYLARVTGELCRVAAGRAA